MSALFAPLVSVAPTKRRRFFWAAYWSFAPTESPFRLPDASSGGARSEEEAHRAAERAAGMPLIRVSSRWARAVQRALLGQPPFPPAKSRRAPETSQRAASPAPDQSAPRPSLWAILGITSEATPDEVKRAFKESALRTHPDRGGTDEAFREVHDAYLEAKKRSARPRKRPVPAPKAR